VTLILGLEPFKSYVRAIAALTNKVISKIDVLPLRRDE